jgi:two-component system, sensor histidine kinase and response regulator
MRFVSIESFQQGLIFGVLLGLSIGLYGQNGLKYPSKPAPHDSILLEQYRKQASIYSSSGELDKMYATLKKGLALAEKSKNESVRGIFLSKIAGFHKQKYQTDSGLIYAQKAIVVLLRQKEWQWVAQTMYIKCMFYLDKNDQVNAMHELIALSRFNEKYRVDYYTGAAYNLLALTFRRLNDTLNEKKYILKHLDFAEKQNSDVHRMHAFEMYGAFLVNQKKFRAAHTYFMKSHLLAKHQKNDEINVEILLGMGANLVSLKEYKKSLDILKLAEKTALKHAKEPGWNAVLSTNYAHISSLFLATGKSQEALDYARRSFVLVQNEPLRYEYLIRALKNQIAAHKALGNFREALQTYEQLQTVTKSIDLNKDREITKDIEAKYQLEKSEREKELFEKSLRIKELELQNQQKQARILWILLGLFAVTLGGGYWFYRKNQVYNHRISKKNQQLEALNDTKDKLFGIIGHDLRAPVVDLINTITLLENANLTAEQLSTQSSALRKKAITLQTLLTNLLYWAFSQRHLLRANPRLIPLKNSIEEALDSLNGLIQEKSLRIEWLTVPKNTIYADENHVQIVLYNVIHNAIKFSPYNSTIEIAATSESPYMVLHVTNQGKEFEWEETADKPASALSHRGTQGEKGTGLGLLVCAELMKLNQGTIRAQRKPAEGTTLVLAFSSPI